MRLSDKDIELEHNHMLIGEESCDEKVPSNFTSTKIDPASSAFDSVAQGNTTNDIHRNEGNSMGNIYSEEARVIGELNMTSGKDTFKPFKYSFRPSESSIR
jgi:hypothetical protein